MTAGLLEVDPSTAAAQALRPSEPHDVRPLSPRTALTALESLIGPQLAEMVRGWDVPRRMRLLRRFEAELDKLRTQWLCDDPLCDGEPHAGAPMPHSRGGERGQREPAEFASGIKHLWLYMGGRGSGKTRTGAETTRRRVDLGRVRRAAIVGPTAGDARDVMVEGPAGLLAVYPKHQRPKYEPSKRRITFHNGALGIVYSADEPDRLRGHNSDWLWADEYASWRTAKDETNDPLAMTLLGLRIGDAQGILTTTPKRKLAVRKLVADPRVIVTRGSTYDNLRNLADSFASAILRYEGTRLGRQELHGVLLSDVLGALWQESWWEREGFRVLAEHVPPLARVVVAVDPAVTAEDESDLTGIVCGGVDQLDKTQATGYVLESKGIKDSPRGVMTEVVKTYRQHHADRVVFEVNNGGDYLPAVLEAVDPTVPWSVVHATRGKMTRAEPVSALYETVVPHRPYGRIRHVGGTGAHLLLEEQSASYSGGSGEESPDLMDANVWLWHELLVGDPPVQQEQYRDTRLRGRR